MNRKKHLFTLLDWSTEDINETLKLAAELKAEVKEGRIQRRFESKTIAMYFEKPSLRTITTFQVGMAQLGGDAVLLDPGSIGLGKRESIADVSSCLGRWVDGIVVRCFSQDLAEKLGEFSQVPTINALTDDFHPCQALAFGQTVIEHFDSLKDCKVTFVGDGNNVANSLAILAAKTGMHFTLACPKGYEQPQKLIDSLKDLFAENGGSYSVTNDPHEGVANADIIYNDVWASMGQEEEQALREKAFAPFQVNGKLMASAPSTCKFTHCLPAHRGEEVTDEVMDSNQTICFDEAENRLHAQKAVMVKLLLG